MFSQSSPNFQSNFLSFYNNVLVSYCSLLIPVSYPQDCKSKPREKVFTNRCNRAKCKKRELVPVICDACRLNYCLAHRHPQDHECQGPQVVNRRRLDHFAAASATASGTSGPPARSSGGQSKLTDFFRSQPTPRSVAAASSNTAPRAAAAMVNGMSEDEALAAAMAASLQDVNQQQLAVRGGGGSSGQSSRQVLTQVWKLIEICISKPLNILKFFEQFL
jgi:hypothetical protein